MTPVAQIARVRVEVTIADMMNARQLHVVARCGPAWATWVVDVSARTVGPGLRVATLSASVTNLRRRAADLASKARMHRAACCALEARGVVVVGASP